MAADDGANRDEDAPAAAASPSSSDRSLVAAVAVGFALAGFSVIADGTVASRALVILGNIISPWALAAFAVGRLAHSWKRGALAGTVSLVIGVVVYYVVRGVRLGVAGELAAGSLLNAAPLVWLVAAVTIGPLLGMAGAVSKRYRPVPVAAIALPSVVLLAEAGFLVYDRRPWLWDLTREPHRFTDLAIMVGLVAIALAIPIRGVSDRRRRLVVLGVATTTAAAGSLALVGLHRLIVYWA